MLGRACFASLLRAALVALLVLCGGACGDDYAGSRDGGVVGEGGQAGMGGAAGSQIKPLKDKTAGKACTSDSQCSPGTCLDVFAVPFGVGQVPAPGGYCSGQCATNADCGDAGQCVGAFAAVGVRGRCLAICTQNSDCRDGYRCVNAIGLPIGSGMDAGIPATLLGANTCQPLPETDTLADGIAGAACTADGDCGAGRCLRTTGTGGNYPGGYCSGRCLADADCGANGSCTPGLAGGAGTCFLRCASDAECTRTGYRCRSNGGAMQCVPGAAPLPDDAVGRACSSEADCGGAAMSCSMRLGRYAAPGGYCTQRCVDASDCGAGGVCVGSRTSGSSACYRTCADSSNCREGYTCGPAGRTGSAAMQNICFVTPPPEPDDAGMP